MSLQPLQTGLVNVKEQVRVNEQAAHEVPLLRVAVTENDADVAELKNDVKQLRDEAVLTRERLAAHEALYAHPVVPPAHRKRS